MSTSPLQAGVRFHFPEGVTNAVGLGRKSTFLFLLHSGDAMHTNTVYGRQSCYYVESERSSPVLGGCQHRGAPMNNINYFGTNSVFPAVLRDISSMCNDIAASGGSIICFAVSPTSRDLGGSTGVPYRTGYRIPTVRSIHHVNGSNPWQRRLYIGRFLRPPLPEGHRRGTILC